MIIEFPPFPSSHSSPLSTEEADLPPQHGEMCSFDSLSALDPVIIADRTLSTRPSARVSLDGSSEILSLTHRGRSARANGTRISHASSHNECAIPLRNFLVLVSEHDDILLDAPRLDPRIIAAAHGLLRDGFVYVAWSFQRQMEDDSAGVRYLSLRERLPSFGAMTAVIVIGEERWADVAAEAYARADIFMLRLKSPPAKEHTTH